MKESIFSKKRILLLGSGELGKELVIESKRLGLEVIAIDRYKKAPAMQVADYSRVIDMGDKNILKNVIKEFRPDYVVPEIEALSIEALKELEDEGFNIVPNARTVEITMNRDKIRDLASKELAIIDCLGIVEGIACPHFDEEKEREPFVYDVIQREIIESCICIEGNCALHIKNDFDYSSIDFGNGRNCFKVTRENNIVKKEIL